MSKYNPRTTLWATALVSMLTLGAGAAAAKLPGGDVKFLQEAAGDGLAEVELGRLAFEKGMRDEVKEFGKRMVDDHTKANFDTKMIASANGVTLPAEMDKKHRKLMDKLGKLSGPDFDRAYMKEMVADHKNDVREFKKRAGSKNENDVKQFAVKTLPVLQEHLEAARVTFDIVNASKRTGNRETGSTRK